MLTLKFYLSDVGVLRFLLIFVVCMIGFWESTQWVFEIAKTNGAFQASVPSPGMFVVFNFSAWLVLFFGLND